MENVTRKNKAKFQQKVITGFSISTVELDGSTSEEVISFGFPAEVISFQASDSLVGNIEFSLDGTNWKNLTAIGGSNAVVSFSTHLVLAVKVTRTGGTGKLSIAAK